MSDYFSFIDKLTPVQHEAIFINKVDVHKKTLQLNIPFETSFGRFEKTTHYYPEIHFKTSSGEVIKGIGECPPLPAPWYDGEYDNGVELILKKHLIKSLKQSGKVKIQNVEDFLQIYKWVVGHHCAKVGLEGAYWDAVGKLLNKPAWKLFGGTRTHVETGTSVGLEKNDAAVLDKIEKALQLGAKRIKIKIKPERDLLLLQKIRKKFSDIPLMVDGNASYMLHNNNHVEILQALDAFDLMMIEQPGPNDDRYYHAALSKKLKTPICLDESILHSGHAIEAISMWENAKILNRLIINIKPPRVGGFWEAIKIANLCAHTGVSAWCGGMLESSVGKTANIHLSTLQGFNIPGDHISQKPYYKKNVANSPKFINGRVSLKNTPGWGIETVDVT